MAERRPAKPGCRGCPIDCRDRRGGKNKDKLGDYARLWSLAPDDPALAALVAEYHRLCDDIGLEAFETARAIALARLAGAVNEEPPAILEALQEAGRGTALGRAIGSGAAAAARHFGLAAPADSGPKKHSGSAPEVEAFLDTVGLCAPAYPPLADSPEARAALADMLRAKYGRDFSAGELAGLGPWLLEMEENWSRLEEEGGEKGEVMSRTT